MLVLHVRVPSALEMFVPENGLVCTIIKELVMSVFEVMIKTYTDVKFWSLPVYCVVCSSSDKAIYRDTVIIYVATVPLLQTYDLFSITRKPTRCTL